MKQRTVLLICPSLVMIIGIFIKLRFYYSSDGVPFVDFSIYKQAFSYYPDQIYHYHWFVYTPSFFVIFFWIGLLPFEIGVFVWFILNAIVLTCIWDLVLKDPRFTNFEKLCFAGLVLVLGLFNEVFVANSDIILLGCGFGAYYILLKDPNNKKSNLLAGLLLALAIFKPLVLIFFPVLFYKSRRKLHFFLAFLAVVAVTNFLFIIKPELLFQFLEKTLHGKTFTSYFNYFEQEWLNLIFRSNFIGPRLQIFIFPAILLYLNLVKNEKTRNKLVLVVVISYLSLLVLERVFSVLLL